VIFAKATGLMEAIRMNGYSGHTNGVPVGILTVGTGSPKGTHPPFEQSMCLTTKIRIH
jgi:hypothetical protein